MATHTAHCPKCGLKKTRTALVLLVLSASFMACSFGKFDDLEELAPATRLQQEGSISTDFFGQLLHGLPLPSGGEGGRLLVAGTGTSQAFNTFTISASGAVGSTQTDVNDYQEDLGLGEFRPRSLATAPSDTPVGTLEGPFLYMGATSDNTGSVAIGDAIRFEAAEVITPENLPESQDFGASVYGARLGKGATEHRDLVVGGRSRVWLYRFADWPKAEGRESRMIDSGADGWPQASAGSDSTFTSLAAGNLDSSTDEDEVVIAAPGQNYVVIIYRVSTCFDEDGECPIVRVPVPSGAADGEFGRDLLIADVDGDDALELVVGAPQARNRGALYVYDLTASHFSSGNLPDPREIRAPEAANDFGHSLAFGRLEGAKRSLLAVGAPGTAVQADGKSVGNAGAIYLYNDQLDTPTGEATLKSPEEGELLGFALAVIPFGTGGDVVDVLASSAKDSALVFFSSLTDQHEDVRAR